MLSLLGSKLYSTQVTQDGLNCTLIGHLVSWSTGSLAGLVKELIPLSCVCTSAMSAFSLSVLAHRNGLNARALFIDLISSRISITTPAPYAPA